MIIDADCHLSTSRSERPHITADALVALMDRAGVDRALLWQQPQYDGETDPGNRAVYEAVLAFPDRLVGIGWVNPRLGHEQAVATIGRCFEEYGFQGIKFNGAQDRYVIDEPWVLDLVARAAEYGKPIAFHIGADAPDATHPCRLGRIAAALPETQFLMVHMGGAGAPLLDRAAVETALEHPNVTLVGSAIKDTSILEAINRLGAHRVCFGSDTPFFLMHAQLAMYRALLRDHSQQERDNVLGGNVARLLAMHT
ncbi:MAG: amidohydrolase family protein [Anaerolineae bacterium]